jgi:hypothetical protein
MAEQHKWTGWEWAEGTGPKGSTNEIVTLRNVCSSCQASLEAVLYPRTGSVAVTFAPPC